MDRRSFMQLAALAAAGGATAETRGPQGPLAFDPRLLHLTFPRPPRPRVSR